MKNKAISLVIVLISVAGITRAAVSGSAGVRNADHGILYTNMGAATPRFKFAVSATAGTMTFQWKDAGGTDRQLVVVGNHTAGVYTSLAANGSITYSCSSIADCGWDWHVE